MNYFAAVNYTPSIRALLSIILTLPIPGVLTISDRLRRLSKAQIVHRLTTKVSAQGSRAVK
ncbi:MAG: hypothetical protein F6K14_29805 [Symploca sp. SIO2C1]|nr:hypothetical protein [Symploca sp. SIO2C1]